MATKDAGLRIRVERTLRDEFLRACRAKDQPAAQVLREFMRTYVAGDAATDRPVSAWRAEPEGNTRVEGGIIEKEGHRRN